ncbi:MAG TPA: maleylpyruvate isomerase family mycothiol-dependent enzyme [Phytomonospora sp.]
MDPDSHLAHLVTEHETFRSCLDGDLTAHVTTCGDWDLRALAEHMGHGNRWAAAAVTEGRGDHPDSPVPADRAGFLAWYDDSADLLVAALSADPATPAWSFHGTGSIGFWRRRRALEALVHRRDAELALGRTSPIDPAFAADGVAEVFEVMAPRQIARGRATAPTVALRLDAVDVGESWTHGPGEPVARMSGRAEDLLLLLWGRASRDGVTWDGDRVAGERILDGPLVP